MNGIICDKGRRGGAVKPRPPILIFPVKSCDRRYITLYSRI
nr:MAG TPA: MOSC N-terminal beta barrel domain [Caudoviricetes sp.]